MKTKIEYNGSVIFIYTIDKNSKKQGLFQGHYKGDQLCIECTYKDGKKEILYNNFRKLFLDNKSKVRDL